MGTKGSSAAEETAPGRKVDLHVVDTVDRLKSMADPLRIRFLLALRDGPRTVKEVAEVIGVPPTRLYYHLRILERHGLVEVADRRLVSGIEERSYQTTATDWTISPTLAASALYESGALRAMLDVVGSEIEVVVQSRPGLSMDHPGSPLRAAALTEFAMAPEEVPEFLLAFEMFLRKYGDRERAPEHTERFHMFYAVYPDPATMPAAEFD